MFRRTHISLQAAARVANANVAKAAAVNHGTQAMQVVELRRFSRPSGNINQGTVGLTAGMVSELDYGRDCSPATRPYLDRRR